MADRLETLSDSHLVRAHRAGDSRAFGILADRHLGVIYLIGYSVLRDREAAEDLVQEVMLRALLSLDHLAKASRFSAWLTQIARNLAIDWLRKGQRHSRLLPLVKMDAAALEVPDPNATGVREAMSEREDRVMVRQALRRLPPEQREVALLHIVEGLGQREIARRMGLSQATVSRELSRALAAMRESVEALRRAAPSLRISPEVRTQTLALVATAALLSPTAKAALIASAGLGAEASVAASAAAVAEAGGLGALSIIRVALATGGQIMAFGKGVPATLGIAALITGGVYHMSRADEPGSVTTVPPPAAVDVAEPSSVAPPPPPAPQIAQMQAQMDDLTADLQARIQERVQPFVEQIMRDVMAEIGPDIAAIEEAGARNDVFEVIRRATALRAKADDIEARAEASAELFEQEMTAWAETLEAEMGTMAAGFEVSMEQWGEEFSRTLEVALSEGMQGDMEQWAHEFEASMEAWAESPDQRFD